MAVKTEIPQEGMCRILSVYDLGEFLEYRPISQGTVQTNYRIRTEKATVVMRYYENRTRESVRFEANLIRYIYARGFPCPAILADRQGQLVSLYRDKPFALFAFIEGEHLANPSEEQKRQLVEQVAHLHNLTRGYRPACTEHRLNYNVETCARLAHEASARIGTANAREKLRWYLDQLDRLELNGPLPKGVCHCDFHFTNILFLDGRFNALLDFDDANYTYLLFDVAYLLEPFKAPFDWDTWSQFSVDDNVFDFYNARKVLAEYERHRPLNVAEKRHLFDVFKLGILVDCIWYFERGDVRDFFEKRKLEYLDRLGRECFYQRLFG